MPRSRRKKRRRRVSRTETVRFLLTPEERRELEDFLHHSGQLSGCKIRVSNFFRSHLRQALAAKKSIFQEFKLVKKLRTPAVYDEENMNAFELVIGELIERGIQKK